MWPITLSGRLCIVALVSSYARVQITQIDYQNPDNPPNFVMMLRKYLPVIYGLSLGGSTGVRQVFDFFKTELEMVMQLAGTYDSHE